MASKGEKGSMMSVIEEDAKVLGTTVAGAAAVGGGVTVFWTTKNVAIAILVALIATVLVIYFVAKTKRGHK